MNFKLIRFGQANSDLGANWSHCEIDLPAKLDQASKLYNVDDVYPPGLSFWPKKEQFPVIGS